jgi:hypothetical protein
VLKQVTVPKRRLFTARKTTKRLETVPSEVVPGDELSKPAAITPNEATGDAGPFTNNQNWANGSTPNGPTSQTDFCGLCRSSLPRGDLVRHYTTLHAVTPTRRPPANPGTKKYKCTTCGMRFVYSSWFARHKMTKHAKRKKALSSKPSSVHHARRAVVDKKVDEPGYECEVCHDRFYSEFALASHTGRLHKRRNQGKGISSMQKSKF